MYSLNKFDWVWLISKIPTALPKNGLFVYHSLLMMAGKMFKFTVVCAGLLLCVSDITQAYVQSVDLQGLAALAADYEDQISQVVSRMDRKSVGT